MNLEKNGFIWLVIIIVFLVVFGAVGAVLIHDEEKPKSPQALVASAFNQTPLFNVLNNGRGTQPILYHPAAFENVQWNPLYFCPRDGAVGTPLYTSMGVPYCPLCGQIMVMNK